MSPAMMYYPALFLILLTLCVLTLLFRGRSAAVAAGELSPVYFKTYDTGETLPRKVAQADRCYHNLLQSTPAFYFLCLAVIALQQVDLWFVVLAWAFVLARLLQTIVHLTSNKIGPRSQLFMVGQIVMLAIGLRLAWLTV